MKTLRGKNVFVFGAGLSGVAAARYAHSEQAHVVVADDVESHLEKARLQLPSSVTLLVNPKPHHLRKTHLLVLSPGIPLNHPLLKEAKQRHIPILNELDLAAKHLGHSKTVGITGTNGKSSTTALLGSILQATHKPYFVGGNLGLPLCDYLLEHAPPSYAAIELSSYQLEIVHKLQLDVAIITNLSPDHLDRYDSAQSYYQAKFHIADLLKPTGFLIVNGQDPILCAWAKQHTTHPVFFFDASNSAQWQQEMGLLHSPFLFAKHHFENAMAATLAARLLGLTQRTIQGGIHAYKGIAHRLEFIGEHNGMRWYNDSKSTNVHSAITAISCFENNVHLILGGVGKGASYAPLVKACLGRVKAVYAIGQDASAIMQAFQKDFHMFACHTLDQAVSKACANSQPGDILLLSPACASLDQFQNYMHRGAYFRSLFEQRC